MPEATEQVNESSEYNLSPAKQEPMEEVESVYILESLKIDNDHSLQPQLVLRSTSQPHTDTDKRCQQCPLQEHAEQDTEVHQDDKEHSVKDTVVEATSTQSDQSPTVFLPTDDVTMPIEQVGCTLVTCHLQHFLEDYPPSSDKHASLNVYHMLSLLDKYLYDNPKQHTHCMSSDNEYVRLLKYAIPLNIDLSTVLTLWAVLSILLDIQDGKLEYVKLLQEE